MNEQIEVDVDPDGYLDPMTTLLGIKCKDGIVVASDSQTTHKIEKTKALDVSKISVVNCCT